MMALFLAGVILCLVGCPPVLDRSPTVLCCNKFAACLFILLGFPLDFQLSPGKPGAGVPVLYICAIFWDAGGSAAQGEALVGGCTCMRMTHALISMAQAFELQA